MPMHAALTPFALVLAVVLAPSLVAAERPDKPDKPALRSTMPSRVDAPRPATDTRAPVRVRNVGSHTTPTSDTTPTVNINTADVKSLMTLTGVGRRVAEKIVEYRERRGPFKKADELRRVEGVGTGVWERNRGRIVVK